MGLERLSAILANSLVLQLKFVTKGLQFGLPFTEREWTLQTFWYTELWHFDPAINQMIMNYLMHDAVLPFYDRQSRVFSFVLS